jgi:hypothetical protein
MTTHGVVSWIAGLYGSFSYYYNLTRLEACGAHYTSFSSEYISCKNRPQVIWDEVALVSKLYL